MPAGLAFFWLIGNAVERRLLLIIIIAVLAPGGSAWADGSIEGVVALPKPTMARPLNQRYRTDVEVPEAPTDPPIAVVYLLSDSPVKEASTAKSLVKMAQKNAMFEPELLAIQVGTSVDFPNLDDTYHNVFSYSKLKRFDLGRYRKDEKPATVVFDKPGAVTVHCEIHDRMRGTILVLETPY